jgi:hypothetical protein
MLLSRMKAAWRDTAPSSWDFFSGRVVDPAASELPTRADRAAVQRHAAAWALAATLARDDAGAFWRQAREIRAADDPAKTTQRIAALYVPRRSLDRATITRLLYLGSRHVHDERRRTARLVNAGLRAYFPDGPERRNALNPNAMVTINVGATLVARRGAQHCLYMDADRKTGEVIDDCGKVLLSRRRPSDYQVLRNGTSIRDYCDDCRQKAEANLNYLASWHREAIKTVLTRARGRFVCSPLGLHRESFLLDPLL